MRIATVSYHGTPRSGVVSGGADEPFIELFRADTNLLTVFGQPDLSGIEREPPIPLRSMPSLPPAPNPGKILCLAGNYREHIIESGFVAPETEDVVTQQVFLKPATCLIGNRAEIPIGPQNAAVGWEVELAVVIGRGGRNIPASEALNHVFGYTILNDISERKLNSGVEHRKKREFDVFFDWLAGKWFDGFAPCGPWIITADEVPNPHDLGIRLSLNGELRQESNTRAMIFDIPAQIEYASSITRLEPGDIISTGTPAGAGLGSGSKVLKDGDEVVCEIDRIGTLRNRVRATA